MLLRLPPGQEVEEPGHVLDHLACLLLADVPPAAQVPDGNGLLDQPLPCGCRRVRPGPRPGQDRGRLLLRCRGMGGTWALLWRVPPAHAAFPSTPTGSPSQLTRPWSPSWWKTAPKGPEATRSSNSAKESQRGSRMISPSRRDRAMT